MNRSDIRDTLSQRFQRAAEKLSEQMTDVYQVEVEYFLAHCEKVFPEHKFTAQQAHGILFVRCEPPIAGKNDISQWDVFDEEDDERIVQILSDFETLKDWALSMEESVGVNIYDIQGNINSRGSKK